jgi:hypothetical protein
VLIGFYTLKKSEEGDKFYGKIQLGEISPEGKLTVLQDCEETPVLDLKWLPKKLNGKVYFVSVFRKGRTKFYLLEGNKKISEHQKGKASRKLNLSIITIRTPF